MGTPNTSGGWVIPGREATLIAERTWDPGPLGGKRTCELWVAKQGRVPEAAHHLGLFCSGSQLCPELVEAILLAFSPSFEGERQCPGPGWQLPGLGCGPLLRPFTPQPPAGVHVLQHDRRAGRSDRATGPGGEPRPWLATWPRPPGSGLAAHSARGGRPRGLSAAPRWLYSGGLPASGRGCAHLASQQACLPQLSCGNLKGLRLPGPLAGWPLSAHSRRAGCQAVGLRNAGWPQLPGVCPGRVGRRVEDGPGHPGLTLREGRALCLRATPPPQVYIGH